MLNQKVNLKPKAMDITSIFKFMVVSSTSISAPVRNLRFDIAEIPIPNKKFH